MMVNDILDSESYPRMLKMGLMINVNDMLMIYVHDGES